VFSNVTKQRLKAGKIAFGLGVRSARQMEIALIAAASNYHYLFIDREHSTMDLDTAAQISAAAIAAGVTPIIRVQSVNDPDLPRLLDGGAQGIVVPHVETAEQARLAARYCLQPPIGRRSSGGAAIQLGWNNHPSAETARLLNEQTLLVVMAETCRAIANIDEIAAVDGIDVISVGTNDLSLDLGVPNDFDHPAIQDAHAKVLAAAQRHGKAVRLGGRYDERDIVSAVKRGARFVTLGVDQTFLITAMRAKAAAISGAIASDADLAGILD
jgi:2-keto-3-deoxy-L-rhamnonate aldolase RhmA